MTNGGNNLYEFGNFRLDAAYGTLWREDALVSLSPKALELLKLLVERGGEVVSKQEIFENIWAGTFVEEGVLTQNIYTLRKVLGRDEEGSQFIETVPRRGYRFTGQVQHACVENGKNEQIDVGATKVSLTTRSGLEPFSRTNRIYLLGLVILLLTGGAVAFAVYRYALKAEQQIESAVSSIEQLRRQRLTDSGDVLYPTISPNGEMLAYVRLDRDTASIWVKQIATGDPIPTLPPSSAGYRSLAFSRDGSYLFFRENADPSSIYKASPLGGTPIKVAENVWSDFSVSPDDGQLAFFRRDPARDAYLLILSNIDGSGERELSSRESPLFFMGGSPAWSPDGKRLIVASGSKQEARPVLLSVDAESGGVSEVVTPRWRDVSRILWMPNRDHLIVAARASDESSSQLWMVDLQGGVERLTNDLEAYFWCSITADGRSLVTRQQEIYSNLWSYDNGDPEKAQQLTSGRNSMDGFRGLARTPDGRIVFSARTDQITDLYSMGRDGSERIQLTSNAGNDNTWPTASFDGTYLVFTSHRSGARQIWRMDIDGQNQTQLTAGDEPKESAHSAVLSPDGKEVYFIRLGTGPSSIWKTSVNGGIPVQVSRLTNATAEGFLSISPDGKWLAYRHVEARQNADSDEATVRIGLLPSDGIGDPRFFDLPMRRPVLHWAADSQSFDYIGGALISSTLWRQPLDGSPVKLIEFPERAFNFAWSMDGNHLVVAQGQLRGDAIRITNLP